MTSDYSPCRLAGASFLASAAVQWALFPVPYSLLPASELTDDGAAVPVVVVASLPSSSVAAAVLLAIRCRLLFGGLAFAAGVVWLPLVNYRPFRFSASACFLGGSCCCSVFRSGAIPGAVWFGRFNYSPLFLLAKIGAKNGANLGY